MDHNEFINPRAIAAFKEYLKKYEAGEVLNFTIIIDDCQLTMRPLGLNESQQNNDDPIS